jgi:cysteinyl-tRNA synthetase
MNVTDLDDRTIEGAENAGLSLREFTEKYFQEFLKDIESLNIKKADQYPRATDHVEDMIKVTQKLLEKGYAYEKFRSIYFDISRFKDYGGLSRVDLEKIRVGKTVDLEQYEKENPRDFTLLKRSTLNELKKGIYYQTPWGNIRPSWHLECPVMSMKYLGETYDIHTSGIDLVFPHHENSIAINRALTGKPPVNYWLHNELVMINGKKSSSNTDNEYAIRNIIKKGYTGREIRYWLISSNYRKPITFTWEKLDMAKKTVSGMDRFVIRMHYCQEGDQYPEIDQLIYDLKSDFIESMDDDFNIAPALAALFRFTNKINKVIDKQGLAQDDKKKIRDCLEGINSVLGVMDLELAKPDGSITELIKKREDARKAKDWKTADSIRDELKEKMGIELIDSKDGTIWRKKDKGKR